MQSTKRVRSSDEENRGPTHLVRLPGFLIEEDVGLGDIVKRLSYAVGIKPCSGCENRAQVLNRWLNFTR
jgi:hypothetical protein